MRNFFFHIQVRLMAMVLFVFLPYILKAQSMRRFSSRTFSVENGLMADYPVDIAEDGAGFIWISFGAGLQRYNGKTFRTIPPQLGLPETNHPHFFELQNGGFWIYYHSGISAYNNVTGKFKIVYHNNENRLKETTQTGVHTAPVTPVLETPKVVWCWSAPKQQFFAINKSTDLVTDSLKIKGQPDIEGLFKQGVGNKLFFSTQKGLAELDFSSKKIINRYPAPKGLEAIYDYAPLKNSAVLLATNKGIFKVNIKNAGAEWFLDYPAIIDTSQIGRLSLNYLYGDLFVLTINNKVFIFDIRKRKFLYRLVNQQNRDFFKLAYINRFMADRFHNLWLLAATGLKKINFDTFNIKYYGVKDVRDNFARCIFADKKANLVIVGSLLNHLSVFDTTGHLLKQFNIPPSTSEQQVSCVLKAAKDKYLIFARGKYTVYLLNTASMKLSPLYKGNGGSRYHVIKVIGDTAALLAQPEGIVKVEYSPQKIRIEPIVHKRVFGALADDKGRLWIGGIGKFFILSGKGFKEEKTFYLNEDVVTKCFYQDKQKNIWLGTEKGLYEINPNNAAVIKVYKKEDGLADENIYCILEDNHQNIWVSTNEGISCIYKNGHILNLYAADGLQGHEFNSNVGVKAADGELFFGGTEGVNSFYPAVINKSGERPLVELQSIKVMGALWKSDTAAWQIHTLRLPYKSNTVTFNFVVLGQCNSYLYDYQYKMEGIDPNWVDAGHIGRARYVLPPGHYTFAYTANAGFGAGKNLKYLSVIITPPFWQTLWFKLLIALILAVILWTIFHQYHKRKYQKQLQQLKIQQGIQEERHRISRDLHDHIGAYTTALASGAEQLNLLAVKKEVQKTAEGISANARSIMASLKETIWVLNNDTITLTDFFDRFKVYALKILQHYPGFEIEFHDHISKDIQLSPAEALNAFRVMQESLHNALRHSCGSKVEMTTTGDSEIMRFSMKDNGKGFDVHQESRGNGLYNTSLRCEEAGFRLIIVSDDTGTSISMEKNHSFAV